MNGKYDDRMETYLTIEEAARYLKPTPQTIRKYVLNKTIPCRKVQKPVRFRVSEIEQWIDEGEGNSRKVLKTGGQLNSILIRTETTLCLMIRI